ncbi:MAG: glucose 1-dehydrogenase [Candidatus Bathyarchaeia archaeon]|jgi:2-deoxy-D-gluconate 3-dehydrogenase
MVSSHARFSEFFDLSGKVALVTGASRGIGFAAATALAVAGADIIVCSRKLLALGEVVKEIELLGRKTLAVQSDVSDPTSVRNMISEACRAFGKLDILVNNAGQISRKPATEWSVQEWTESIDVNLRGTFLCCQEVGRNMILRKEGGKIINVASLLSAIGVPNIVPYASSKGGVASLTRSLAVEWAKYRINVNAIGPGYIRTELTRTLQEDVTRSSNIVSRIPIGRWGTPQDLKGTFVFLASPASDYITGQTIYVDGGWTAG